jgi:putative copper export protein/methionine-rich copper-binding protein CopC
MLNSNDINNIKISSQHQTSIILPILLLFMIIFAFSIFSYHQPSNQNYLIFDYAYGHALPVTYSPAPNSIINKNETMPSKITISFSERPDPKASYIQVLDSNNQRVDNNDFKVTGQQHGREAEVTLHVNKLTDGVYTVSWLTLSADDGHIAKGSYVFGIGNVAGGGEITSPSLLNSTTSSGSTVSSNNNNFAQQNQVKTEAVTSNWDGIIKWPLIVAQAAIVGGIISHIFLWNNNKFVRKILTFLNIENRINRNNSNNTNSIKGIKFTDVDNNAKQIEKIRSRPLQILILVLCSSSVSIFACGTALFFLQINDLSNSGSNFFSLFETLLYGSVGNVWVIRSILSLVVIAMSLGYYFLEKRAIKREFKGNYRNYKKNDNITARKKINYPAFLLYIALVAGTICIFANSMTSHSSAVTFLPYIAIFLDWIHFMAVSVWVGGLFYVSTVLLTLWKSCISFEAFKLKKEPKDNTVTNLSINSDQNRKSDDKVLSNNESVDSNKDFSHRSKGVYFIALLLPKFSLLATISLGIIGVSGLYIAWIHLHSFSALFDTSYGSILILKLLTILPVIVLGGYHQVTLHNYMNTIGSITKKGNNIKDREPSELSSSTFKDTKKKLQSFFSNKNTTISNSKFFNTLNKNSNENKNYSNNYENLITEKEYTDNTYSKFNKTIKIESLLAIAVLFIASILTITSPPASMDMSSPTMMMMGAMGNDNINTNQNQHNNGSVQKATPMAMPGITGSPSKITNNTYSNEVKIMNTNTKIQINPFYTGFNTFKITFTNIDGKPVENISNVIMQFTNDQANIGPIVVNLNKINEGLYSIFGGYLSQKGNWTIHLTAQRLNAYDLNYEFDVDLKQQPSSSNPITSLLPGVKVNQSSKPQSQKLSSLSSIENNSTMNQSEAPPSFDSFALLAIILSGLVIFGSAYSFKKSKQQLKETMNIFEKQDKE